MNAPHAIGSSQLGESRPKTLREHLLAVRELRHLLVESREELTAVACAEVDRIPHEMIATDLLPTAAACRFLETDAARILAPRRISGRPLWLIGCRDVVHRRPRGIVGILGTWNYPIFLNAVPILHALVAGNAVIWKPSERTPKTATLLHELFLRAGFSPERFTMWPATRDGGETLIEADIDFLHFTGSEPIGRKIATRLGERLIPSSLELSGCDAMIVLPDADVQLAARAAWYGATLNRGRTCMAVRRAIVARPIFEAFANALRALPANGISILIEPAPGHPSRRDATFEPILAVMAYDTLDDAVRCHAESPFRLTASIFTNDANAANELAGKLRVGAVTINDVIAPTAHPATPFGGRGAAGWGVTQGVEGLLEMTVPQVVTTRKGKFRPHIDAAISGNPAAGDVTTGMLRMTHARQWRERWSGMWQMLRGMRNIGKSGDSTPSPPA